jgi:hypothetical protein
VGEALGAAIFASHCDGILRVLELFEGTIPSLTVVSVLSLNQVRTRNGTPYMRPVAFPTADMCTA